MSQYAQHILSLYSQFAEYTEVKRKIIQGLNYVYEVEPSILDINQFKQLLDVVQKALSEYDQKVSLSASELLTGIVSLLQTVLSLEH